MQNTIFSPQLPAKAGEQRYWCNLSGSSPALAIANTALQTDNRIIAVTADSPAALKLEREIKHFIKHSDVKVSVFPDWETLAYDSFSPHQDIISQRLETLYELTQPGKDIYILPVTTLLQKIAPVEYLGKYVLFLKQGQTLDIEAFRNRLNRAGYSAVNQVMEHGEYSVRGSIIDLYPMGTTQPLRLDLFDDEIESIRAFDPDTQRSGEKQNDIRLLPAHEFPINKQGIEQFKENYKSRFDAAIGKGSIFHDVSSGVMPAGIEYYLPLFFEQTASIFDYISQETLFVTQGDINQAMDFFLADVSERYEQHRWDPLKPLLPPEDLFLRVEELNQAIKQWPRVNLCHDVPDNKSGVVQYQIDKTPDIAINAQLKTPFVKLKAQIKTWQDNGTKILFCAETAGRKEALLELLAEAEIKPVSYNHTDAFLSAHESVGICIGYVDNSFVIEGSDGSLAFVTETELLGHKVSQRRLRKKHTATDESAVIRNLVELQPGQPVVHIEHGVGRYLGLQTLDAGGVTTEYLTIEYAKQSKLYVPVASLHLISRYSGGNEQAPLHNLGTDTWSKARQKAAEKVRDVAAQLLEVYAQREAKPGQACKIDWQEYRHFADSFPFEETDDQQQAINAVINDMGSAKAMDRLVCGDVGFGKTEVAMRAAFIAASQGKQVAVLVPTTLLAQQHYENFRDRMSQWPFQIEVMSRFNTSKEQKQVLAGIAEGKVDIVIGTHKLIQKDVKFADLGLLIIDEEHRFGVQQKEKIKSLRAEVDILTLTATPIPRTLNMALSGMRDLSIIATPPAKRLAIKTFVKQRDKALIREAVMREILRGGQVYFLHNEVESIEKTASEISEIVPEAKVAVAHGQMREKELERVMSDFYHQRFNVLVCTTIIETGIDIPSANTIIMDRADHLGLAQLHQLRGRVGRSHHQAYAYLLTPHPKRMTKDATKRLEAIAQSDNLGAGFELATHDLEIRGAGELLGEEQSGQITTVGFSLYMEMLEEAVEALKAGKQPSLDNLMAQHTEVELRLPTLLPEDYIADVNIRLSMYKKIASCKDKAALKDIQVELIDRFGMLPQATKNLFKVHELKLKAKNIGIQKIDANAQGGFVEFGEQTNVDPGFIIQLIQSKPDVYRFDGPQKLKFVKVTTDAIQRLAFIEGLVNDFNRQQKVA
ncbi:transcription-repair coupling factor [Planctobacterium marinum]|uniref:Transcription-repair-coupling factor n=1 Tax=Planctobacterium marinum TaxID=1631968 RepID=A0AA48KQP0_9ALTE|nr:transcription-repair-coupling factor [Planctobacterium marinum]